MNTDEDFVAIGPLRSAPTVAARWRRWIASLTGKHGVAFAVAQLAFADPNRVIAEDLSHGFSAGEKRYYCFGRAEGGVLTVRCTFRDDIVRIYGAGYWRRGKTIYEHENPIHE